MKTRDELLDGYLKSLKDGTSMVFLEDVIATHGSATAKELAKDYMLFEMRKAKTELETFDIALQEFIDTGDTRKMLLLLGTKYVQDLNSVKESSMSTYTYTTKLIDYYNKLVEDKKAKDNEALLKLFDNAMPVDKDKLN